MMEPEDIPPQIRGWLVGKWAVLMTGVAASFAAGASGLVVFVVLKANEKLDTILINTVPAILYEITELKGRVSSVEAVNVVQSKQIGRLESPFFSPR